VPSSQPSNARLFRHRFKLDVLNGECDKWGPFLSPSRCGLRRFPEPQFGAYCSSPLPKDQSSLALSTRVMKMFFFSYGGPVVNLIDYPLTEFFLHLNGPATDSDN
jgi:hypothetical protein